MINFRNLIPVTSWLVVLSFFGLTIAAFAQAPTPSSDVEQISNLMTSLSDHTKSPSDVLDPQLNASDRQANIKHFSAPNYELSLVPISGIPAPPDGFSSVPIRVHFDDKDGNSLDANGTAHFVKRGGTWYFANFGFMSWPAFLIITVVLGVLVGISYAAIILILGNKLLKHGPLGINGVKMFLPFFWPSLFRQTR